MTGLELAIPESTVPNATDSNATNCSTSNGVGTPGAVPGAVAGDAKGGLARVVEAWPTLPEPLRRAVLALIEAAG